VDFDKAHQGQHRQQISDAELEQMTDPEQEQAAGSAPGVTAELKVPEISNPSDEAEVNLHGDVAGSPYSATPGTMSLAEADEADKADKAPEADKADAPKPKPPSSSPSSARK
jgi:hypothetical protein